MQSHSGQAKFVGRFDSDYVMSQSGKVRCIRSGSRTNIQHGTWGERNQMENMLVFFRKGQAFSAFDKVFSLFRVALRTVNHEIYFNSDEAVVSSSLGWPYR